MTAPDAPEAGTTAPEVLIVSLGYLIGPATGDGPVLWQEASGATSPFEAEFGPVLEFVTGANSESTLRDYLESAGLDRSLVEDLIENGLARRITGQDALESLSGLRLVSTCDVEGQDAEDERSLFVRSVHAGFPLGRVTDVEIGLLADETSADVPAALTEIARRSGQRPEDLAEALVADLDRLIGFRIAYLGLV